VFVGSRDARFEDHVPDRVAHFGLSRWVRFVQDVTERELRALYHLSDLFAYPSFVEGFGLPLLEAMAAGVPVIASDIDSVRELHGDAARLVPPSDSSAWAVAITELLRDEVSRSQMSQRGRAIAAGATWHASATRFLEVLNLAALPRRNASHR
jgi:glycosyltransferase involved in cell wall biosynthesis